MQAPPDAQYVPLAEPGARTGPTTVPESCVRAGRRRRVMVSIVSKPRSTAATPPMNGSWCSKPVDASGLPDAVGVLVGLDALSATGAALTSTVMALCSEPTVAVMTRVPDCMNVILEPSMTSTDALLVNVVRAVRSPRELASQSYPVMLKVSPLPAMTVTADGSILSDARGRP